MIPFVLDVAIMQKCRRRDYQAVSEILSLAQEYDVAGSPMCRQAFELLERIASCSTAIRLRSGAPSEGAVPERSATNTAYARLSVVSIAGERLRVCSTTQ